MKVGLVSIYPEKNRKHSYKGGVSPYTKNLAEGLLKNNRRLQLIILADKQKKETTYFEFQKRLKVVRAWSKGIFFYQGILRSVKKENLKVLHLHHEFLLYGGIVTPFSFLWLLYRLKKMGIKTIVTIHGVFPQKVIDKNFIKENNLTSPVFLVKKSLSFNFKWIGKLSDKIIVHEKIFKNFLVKDYGFDPQKVSVVFLGVEQRKPEISQTKARKILKIKQKRVVLFFGYVTAYKEPEILLKAFVDYTREDKEVLLIFAGGKHPQAAQNRRYLKRYQQLRKIAEKIKKEQIRWLGFIKEGEIEKIIMASDLLVFPYRLAISASGPLAFALAYQKPFLVSQSLANMFDNQKIIFKLKTGDLLRKLKEFFGQKNEFSNFIKIERKRRLWKNVARETLEIYREYF